MQPAHPSPSSDDPVPLIPLRAADDRAARTRAYAVGNAIVLGLLVGMLGLAWMARPVDGRIVLFGRTMPETCFYKRMTGRPCVGCGTTRSLVLAVHGRWAESRAMHPSGIWFLGFLLCQFLLRASLLVVHPAPPNAISCVDPIASAVLMLLALYLPIVL